MKQKIAWFLQKNIPSKCIKNDRVRKSQFCNPRLKNDFDFKK